MNPDEVRRKIMRELDTLCQHMNLENYDCTLEIIIEDLEIRREAVREEMDEV